MKKRKRGWDWPFLSILLVKRPDFGPIRGSKGMSWMSALEDHKNPSQKIHIVHRRGRLNTDGKFYFNVSKSEAGRERERKKEKERERETKR